MARDRSGLVPESTLPERRKGLRTLRLDPPIYRHFGLMVSRARKLTHAAHLLVELARQQSH